MKNQTVPRSLRYWFIVHFVADLLFALPLLFAPISFLSLLGWQTIDPLACRLVGAALVGIGVESYLGRNASLESFRTMLRLKILWSLAANFGIALSLYEGVVPQTAWLFQIIFGGFSLLWIYYKLRIESVQT